MSYGFGQFRRTQLNSYSTPLRMILTTQQYKDESGGNIIFYNRCGSLVGENIVDNQNNYYLRFGVRQREDSEQSFILKLRNSQKTEDNEQAIQEYKVPKGTDIIYFETVLAPNTTYNQILWELQRIALDYKMGNESNIYGRVMDVIIDKYVKLVDIIAFLKTYYPNLEYLTKIGIQGPPSLFMCINREQIRIGKSGIYEINNGIKITSINFILENSIFSNGLDYFIMDFEY